MLDNDGKDELIADFAGYGVWAWRNNAAWSQVHAVGVSRIAVGNLDGTAGQDLVL